MRSLLALFLLAVAVRAETPHLRLQPLVSGLAQPTSFAHDGSARLYVTEQAGRVRLIVAGRLEREPWLEITDRVKDGGECGLLGLAFHPDFARNGRFFVNYTTTRRGSLETVVAEFHAPPGAAKADASSERVLLTLAQPYSNHNGGQITFGPDGMLYIATGDGGAGGDPEQAGQSLETLLGKMLRLDVDGESTEGLAYRIPPDNPFIATPKARPEIWAWGLRNPWRFSFDRKTGLLWAADVGQNKWEEINLLEKGKNYGWSAREGRHDFKPERAVGPMVDPIKEYGREQGLSVTGGYVYRGKAFPKLDGLYFYADFASRRLWALRCEGPGQPVTLDVEIMQLPFNPSAFGEDRDGELYLLGYDNGRVYRMVQ